MYEMIAGEPPFDGPTAQATLSGIQDRHIQGAIVIYMRPEGRDDDG